MKDQNKTKKELIAENKRLRQRIQELEELNKLAGSLAGAATVDDCDQMLQPPCRCGPPWSRV